MDAILAVMVAIALLSIGTLAIVAWGVWAVCKGEKKDGKKFYG